MNASSALLVGKTDSYEEEREVLRTAFLKEEGLEKEPLIPIPGDASKRSYYRLKNALLMDAPPPYENTAYFQAMAELLKDAGLSVPSIYAANHTYGFLLIEDLGDLSYRKALEGKVSESLLYEEAINALIHLHQNILENKTNLPHYDLDHFLREAEIFIDWYGPPFSEGAKADFKGLWTEAYQKQLSVPQSIVMRDVMVDNLMWLSSRQGFKRCGFIDFQDGAGNGVWGPVTYDLVSLLEDARRDIDPQFAHNLLKIYLKSIPELSQKDFWESYYLWGAQRSTKILGIFSRLAKRDGKPKYLAHLPRVKRILKRDLQHPSLKAIRHWFRKIEL